MSDVTRILSQIEQGDPQAAEKLLPLVYEELMKLAAVKFVQEKPGQALQATAIVHEAYLQFVGQDRPSECKRRGHSVRGEQAVARGSAGVLLSTIGECHFPAEASHAAGVFPGIPQNPEKQARMRQS